MSIKRWTDKEVLIYNTIQPLKKKQKKTITCDNMDEYKGYYAKQNNPVIEGQILYDST